MALITLPEAKTYLRLLGADWDAELGIKVPQASAIVLDYITVPEGDLAGDDLDIAKAGALEVTRALFEGGDALNGNVKNLLHRLRDPSLA